MDVKSFEDIRWGVKPQKIQFRHRAAVEFSENIPLLDVGCGDGFLFRLLEPKWVESKKHLFGIDISSVGVEKCREQGFNAMVGDVTENLPYEDKQFKTAVALDILEHVYTPVSLAKELHRVAEVVIIGVPNFSSLPARLQVLFGKVPENNSPQKGHLQWFNWDVLCSLVEKCGMKIVDVSVNAPWGLTFLARKWPNLFALSFVIKCL
jgi:methionine biosynthesis protein MetW